MKKKQQTHIIFLAFALRCPPWWLYGWRNAYKKAKNSQRNCLHEAQKSHPLVHNILHFTHGNHTLKKNFLMGLGCFFFPFLPSFLTVCFGDFFCFVELLFGFSLKQTFHFLSHAQKLFTNVVEVCFDHNFEQKTFFLSAISEKSNLHVAMEFFCLFRLPLFWEVWELYIMPTIFNIKKLGKK